MTAASNSDGAIVTVQACNGGDAQKWSFEGGAVKIFGSKCLDVPSATNVDGTKLQIWTCAGSVNQQWSYDKVRAVLL